MNNETTLITGASSGIGMHLGHEFARNGHPVILVAPVESELREVAQQLQAEGGCEAMVISRDEGIRASLTESLATELEDTGITATALCPGPTDTDFFLKADMTDTRAMQHAMAPQDVAKAGYKACMDGDRVIVPGGMNKFRVGAPRILSGHAQSHMNEKFYEELPEEKQKYDRGDIETKAAKKD